MENTEFNLKPKQELLNDVKEFYDKEVSPILPEYEKNREEDSLSMKIITLIIIGFVLSFIHPIFIIIFIFPLIIMSNRKTVIIDNSYEMNIKKKLMPKFLSLFGNYKWEKFSTRLIETIRRIENLKIFPNSFLLTLDDTIIGSYKNIRINIYEIRTGLYANSWIILIFLLIFLSFVFIFLTILFFIILIKTSDKISPKILFEIMAFFFITLFLSSIALIYKTCIKQGLKGVLIEYTFPKNFKHETFIYEDAFSSRTLVNKYSKKYEKIDIEDSMFNKKFTIYSNDQVEARYLLTPTFIERFKEINVAFDSVFQRAEFKGNKLYILIKTKKDLFKFGDLNKKTTLENFEQSFEELYSIIKLSDHFKLDQKIGL